MIDKSTAIPRTSSRFPEMTFKRCKGTNPAFEFDQRPPQDTWNVDYYDPPPLQDQESAEYDKRYKREVKNYEKIGCKSGDHRSISKLCRDSLNLGTITSALTRDWENLDLKVSVEELERLGQGLVLDHRLENGARILLWNETEER